MGVNELISSQGFSYGMRERVERMNKCFTLIFC